MTASGFGRTAGSARLEPGGGFAEIPPTEGRISDNSDRHQPAHRRQVDPDGALSPAEEEELYRYYGNGPSADRGTYQTDSAGYDASGYDTVGHGTGRDAIDRDASGSNTANAMTRSEERLQVGTERQRAGKARLRKYVVIEQQRATVPVSRDEVRIEREPITDANIGRAMDGPDISEDEHEVTLHAERAVVDKQTVPVERVRMDTRTVTEEQTVGGEVRKEQIELDDGSNRRTR